METTKHLLLALGLLGSPVTHPPEPCLGNGKPSPAAVRLIQHFGRSAGANEALDPNGRESPEGIERRREAEAALYEMRWY